MEALVFPLTVHILADAFFSLVSDISVGFCIELVIND